MATLSRNVDAEAAFLGELKGNVELVEVQILSRRLSFEQDLRDLLGVIWGQDFVAEFDQLTVEPIERKAADLEVNVGGALFNAKSQQAVWLLTFHRQSFLSRIGFDAGSWLQPTYRPFAGSLDLVSSTPKPFAI
jgi:hypothetical protein